MFAAQNSTEIDGAESRTEQAWQRGLVTLHMLRFSAPAPALTFNHEIRLSFYQRQLQLYSVAFGAVFFTKQEFKTKKFILITVFFNLLITFSKAVCTDSSSCPLQQNVEDGV